MHVFRQSYLFASAFYSIYVANSMKAKGDVSSKWANVFSFVREKELFRKEINFSY